MWQVLETNRAEESHCHVHRMYFMGPNTFSEPWHLPHTPPEQISEIVYVLPYFVCCLYFHYLLISSCIQNFPSRWMSSWLFPFSGMRMHLTNLLMRSMLLQPISGGKVQFIASYVYFHIPWHGRGNSGVGERNYKNSVNLFVPNMIIHVYGPAVRVHFMRGWRYVSFVFCFICSSFLIFQFHAWIIWGKIGK